MSAARSSAWSRGYQQNESAATISGPHATTRSGRSTGGIRPVSGPHREERWPRHTIFSLRPSGVDELDRDRGGVADVESLGPADGLLDRQHIGPAAVREDRRRPRAPTDAHTDLHRPEAASRLTAGPIPDL